MGVLVYVDIKNGEVVKSSLEAVYYASQISGDCIAVCAGNADTSTLEGLGNSGATKVVHHANAVTDNSQLAKLVEQTANANGCNTVVFSHDFAGKAIAPRVAARLNAGIVSGVVEVPTADNTVKKSVFSGKAFATYKINSDKVVLSVLPNSMNVTASGNSASVESDSSDLGSSKVTVKEFKKKGVDGKLDLTEAELVVSAGRGLKGPENWGMVEDLADTIGAATACSRPVADIGWRPHHEHVGQTDIAIRPNLYIAIGISGAIQHLAGVNGSKVIVVINKDPEAPFFKAADYGIVGDAFDVVPKLLEAAKQL
jgi:electron transfer flavoprotein alpha subunit